MEYKVPRLLWENLESVLLAQSKRYISELAKRLDVPEKELLKKVLPTSDSLKITILDSQLECNQCKAYIQHDNITVFCRKSVAYQSEFCMAHRKKRMTVLPAQNTYTIQKVKDSNTNAPMWAMNNNIIDSHANIIGKINKNEGKIKIFVIK